MGEVVEGVIVSLVAAMDVRQEVLPALQSDVFLAEPLQSSHDLAYIGLEFVNPQFKEVEICTVKTHVCQRVVFFLRLIFRLVERL